MMTTPAQSRRYAYLANNLNKEEFTAYYAHLLEGGRAEDFFDKMEKHGTHDQKTHGNWADGSSESGLDAMPYEWKPKRTNDDFFSENSAFATEFMREVASSPVSTRVTGDSLDKIVEDGRFKNLDEIPESTSGRDSQYRESRSRLEGDTWGIPKEEEKPIYGYLDTKDSRYTESIHNYGDVQITFKDSVKGRTTLTGGDSLTSSLIPARVSDLQSGSASGVEMTAALTYSSGYYLSRSERPNTDYFEAQIHGGITLDDIQSVSILASSKVKPSTLAALESRGIEVTVRDGDK
jgi:hypothetical protein